MSKALPAAVGRPEPEPEGVSLDCRRVEKIAPGVCSWAFRGPRLLSPPHPTADGLGKSTWASAVRSHPEEINEAHRKANRARITAAHRLHRGRGDAARRSREPDRSARGATRRRPWPFQGPAPHQGQTGLRAPIETRHSRPLASFAGSRACPPKEQPVSPLGCRRLLVPQGPPLGALASRRRGGRRPPPGPAGTPAGSAGVPPAWRPKAASGSSWEGRRSQRATGLRPTPAGRRRSQRVPAGLGHRRVVFLTRCLSAQRIGEACHPSLGLQEARSDKGPDLSAAAL